jgi:hypothetical protein
MDGDLRGLLITFSLDVIIFWFLVVLFLEIRRERGDEKKKAPLLRPVEEQDDDEEETSLGVFIDTMSDGEISDFRNSDVRLYLTFLKNAANLFTVLSICGLILVLPLNLTGNNMAKSLLGQASAENLTPREWRMWGVYLMTWLYSLIAYRFALHYSKAVRKDPQKKLTAEQRIANFAVMVRGLDYGLRQPELLRAKFARDQNVANHLVSCHIVLDYRELHQAQEALRSAQEKLERCILLKKTNREDYMSKPFMRLLWGMGSREPTIQYYEEEVAYREKVVERVRRKGASRGVGAGFLIFDSTETVRDVLSRPEVVQVARQNGWTLHPAPPPSDVNWQNLHISDNGQWIRTIVLSLALFAVCILLVSPVTVLDELHPLMDNVRNQLNQDNYIRLLVTGYLPPLIILMINSIVIPYLIFHVCCYERFWQKSGEQSAGLHMNIIFMVINSLIIPLTSLNSMGLLAKHMYNTPLEQWNVVIGASFLSSSGSFAIRYLINSSLLSSVVQLCQIPQTIYAKAFALTAVTHAEKEEAERRWVFDFGYWYACALSIFVMCLTFSAAVPLVLPFGALFFFMKYHVDKYNFTYNVHSVDLESRGAVASKVMNYMVSGIAFMQFCMSGFFMVQGDRHLFLAGTLLFVCAIVTWGLLACHETVAMIVPQYVSHCDSEHHDTMEKQQRETFSEAYLHPCHHFKVRPLKYEKQTYGSV